MTDFDLLALDPDAQIDDPTAQIVSPTLSDRGKLASGALISGVPDSATAEGWTLDTPAYTDSEAKLLVIKNNGIEKVIIDLDGGFEGVLKFNAGQLLSAVPDGPTAVGFTLNTPEYLDDDADLLALQNNGSSVFTVSKAGIPTFPGSGGIVPIKEIIINQLSDFGTPSGGSFPPLINGSTYIIGENMGPSTDGWIIEAGAGVTLKGTGLLEPKLEYTGAGDMWTVTDADFEIFSLRMTSPNANQTFNIAHATLNSFSFNMTYCIFEETPNLGTLTNLNTITLDRISYQNVANGFTISGGTVGSPAGALTLSFISMRDTVGGGTFFDLTNSVFSSTLFQNMVLIGAGGSVTVGIEGLIDSGNILPGFQGGIQTVLFVGNITPTVGIFPQDLRWEIVNSSPLKNSMRAADAGIIASPVIDVAINNAGQFEPIGSGSSDDWISEIAERFTVDTEGVLTYVSPFPSLCQVTMSATVVKVSGGTGQEMQLAIAINGIVSLKTIVGSVANDAIALTSIGLFELNENDTVQAFITNADSTIALQVFRASVTIVNGF